MSSKFNSTFIKKICKRFYIIPFGICNLGCFVRNSLVCVAPVDIIYLSSSTSFSGLLNGRHSAFCEGNWSCGPFPNYKGSLLLIAASCTHTYVYLWIVMGTINIRYLQKHN